MFCQKPRPIVSPGGPLKKRRLSISSCETRRNHRILFPRNQLWLSDFGFLFAVSLFESLIFFERAGRNDEADNF